MFCEEHVITAFKLKILMLLDTQIKIPIVIMEFLKQLNLKLKKGKKI